MRGISDTKKQHHKVILFYMYHSEQRACHSPEPEGSEMVFHHSIYKLAEKIKFVKQKVKLQTHCLGKQQILLRNKILGTQGCFYV